MSRGLHPAVFLDRDGTLIHEVDYLADPAGVVLIPGAAEALIKLSAQAYKLVLVTNQSGVAREVLSIETLDAIHTRLEELLREEGAHLDGIYACHHHPDFGSPCSCRKPQPGMLHQAAQDLNLDLSRSWMIGDAERDLEAGRRAGTKALLVRTGKGAELEQSWQGTDQRSDKVLDHLDAAAQWILDRPSQGDAPCP